MLIGWHKRPIPSNRRFHERTMAKKEQPAPGKVKRGDWLGWSEDEIEAASVVTPELERQTMARATDEARELMEADDSEDVSDTETQ
jgi:hypothetical protein